MGRDRSISHPRRAFLAVYFFSPGMAGGLPGKREESAQKGVGDLHLAMLSELVLPLLVDERLTVDELFERGRGLWPVAFSKVDRNLLWRYLTWAERQRLVSRVILDDPAPERWQWDLTPSAPPVFSFWALMGTRLKFGALLGLAGLVATVIGADEQTVVRVVVASLALIATATWLHLRLGRWLMNWGTEWVAMREIEVQEIRAAQAIPAWWPALERTTANVTSPP